MIKEIKAQIDRIESQITAEQVVYKSMKQYTDSEMKTVVINQQIGVVRGLEVAKESLNYLLAQCDNRQMQMDIPAEDWKSKKTNLINGTKRDMGEGPDPQEEMMRNIVKRNTIPGDGNGSILND